MLTQASSPSGRAEDRRACFSIRPCRTPCCIGSVSLLLLLKIFRRPAALSSSRVTGAGKVRKDEGRHDGVDVAIAAAARHAGMAVQHSSSIEEQEGHPVQCPTMAVDSRPAIDRAGSTRRAQPQAEVRRCQSCQYTFHTPNVPLLTNHCHSPRPTRSRSRRPPRPSS